MFEMSAGYVIGMLTGYLIFRRSAVEVNRELKGYLEELIGRVKGGENNE